jgi:hypothetical protein
MDRSPGPLYVGNLSLVCLQHLKLIRAALICLDCLVLNAKLSSRLRAHMSGRAGLLTGQRVSSGPDPLVGVSHECGRWGPRGISVTSPERCVGAATSRGS